MNKKLYILVLLLFIADIAFGQCAMCKALAESSGEDVDHESIGSGLNTGILYLIAIPYILLVLFFRKQIVGLFRR